MERKRDESLLGSVVQVPFEPVPRLICCGDDSCAGCRQLLTAFSIRNGGRDQVGEVGDM
jgi:hypothetical protein